MNYDVLKNISQVIYMIAFLITVADLFLWIGLRMCKKYKSAKKAAVAVVVSFVVCGLSLLTHVIISFEMYNM